MFKRLLIGFLISLFMISQGYCADQWDKTDPVGTSNASDIDTNIIANNEALDRLNYDNRQGCAITYSSVSAIIVGAGTIALPNSGGTIVRWRRNSSTTSVGWTDIDTGSEASSTTYYVYGVADADAVTFTCKISTNSSAPSGVTYYKRLGSFYNDSSSNITNIVNDTDWSAGAVYDSGWFAVAIATEYTKTHSLGTTKVLTSIYIADNSDGSGNLVQVAASNDYDSGSRCGTSIETLSTTSIKIQTATNTLYRVSGVADSPTSGYARIIMLALE